MQKELILSDAEKEQNRQRRDRPAKTKSLALVNISIHHKRITINRSKKQYAVYYYSICILRLLCEMNGENVSVDKTK